MSDTKSLKIFFSSPSQINLITEGDSAGESSVAIFEVSELYASASVTRELGNKIRDIFYSWYQNDFEAVLKINDLPKSDSNRESSFGDLEILESLFTRSIQKETLVHAGTIEEILREHTGHEGHPIWKALEEDWSRFVKRMKKSPSN